MASEIKVTINAKGVITGGKEVESGLQNIRRQAQQTQSDLKKAVSVNVQASSPQLDSFASSLKNISGGLGLIGKAGIAGLVIQKTVGFMMDAAEASTRMSNALLGLTTVAKATGNDLGSVTAAAKELSKDGLAPIADVAAGLKNLLSKGFSLPEAIRLLKVTKDSAAFGRQAMISFGDAIRGVTEGIKNENSMMTDNGGITTNLSVMYKEYAATIGTTADKLNEAQKRQAILNGFMKEGEKTAGDAARAADTYAGAKGRLATAIERATAKLGDFITQSSLVKSTLAGLADFVDNLSYSSLTAAEKLDILKKDLSEFKAGLDFNAGERKQGLIDEIANLEKLVALDKLRGAQGEYEAKVKREQLAAAKEQQESAMAAANAEKDRLKEVAKLKKQLIDAGKSELDQLADLRDRRIALAKGDAEAQRLIWADFYDKKKKLEEKDQKSSVKLARQTLKDVVTMQRLQSSVLSESASNPFGVNNTLKDLQVARSDLYAKDTTGMDKGIHEQIHKLDDKIDKSTKAQAIGRGVGGLAFTAQGAQGANGLVSSLAAGGLDMILPGLGQAAKPLLDAFTQGPEATKKMVTEFAKALPDVITGFIEAIPVFVETLVDKAPEVIEKLAEKAPDIITKLIAELPRIAIKLALLMPKVVIALVEGLIKGLPKIVTEAAKAIYDAIARILGALNPFGGSSKSGVKGAINSVTSKVGIKFARGGEVPSNAGTPFTDSVSAQLMPTERVLDRGTNQAFKRFVESGMSNNNDHLMARIMDILERPFDVQSDIKLNDATFANIILNLNRKKQRLS